MSFNRHEYPPTWPLMRRAALARAGNRCEGTARYPDCRAANHEPHPETGSRVVLTLAHLPGTSKMSTGIGDVRCLCQRCHNALDAPMRARHATETRARKRGQLSLFASGGAMSGFPLVAPPVRYTTSVPPQRLAASGGVASNLVGGAHND